MLELHRIRANVELRAQIRHGRQQNARPWVTALKWFATGLASVVIAVCAVGAVAAFQLTQELGPAVHLEGGKPGAPPPQIGDYDGGFNLLIAGSDDGSGEAKYGVRGENLNDVTMLLHVSADHSNAVVVSFPRDLIIPIPSCLRKDGSSYSAMSAVQINTANTYGGLPCIVKTVATLTGLDIPYAGLVHFKGVVEMSNAIGGVPICTDAPINDPYTAPFPLHLPAGTTYVQGDQALAFLRSRHGVGDGSDLGRISSQQVFLSSMLRTIRSSDTLTNPIKLFKLANAAAKNIELSDYLQNTGTMVSMALTIAKIPPANITFVQYPSATGLPGIAPGRVGPLKAQAKALFDLIKADKRFALGDAVINEGSVVMPDATSPTPAPVATAATDASPPPVSTPVLPGLHGQTGAQTTCTKAFSNH